LLFLLDTSADLDEAAAELGGEVGQLLTPLNGFTNKGRKFGIDNGAYARFDEKAFMARLGKELENRERCLFVCAPDVVGSARRTLEVFQHWHPKLFGWPVALVCQDGQEDLPMPWNLIEAVFIGGSTEWKLSKHAIAILKAARILGKWCHVGRVNTPDRLGVFEDLADSIDGTGLSRFTHMRQKIRDDNRALFAEDQRCKPAS